MQAIIVNGDAKEIAALALEAQERQRQTVRLAVDGKDVLRSCPSLFIAEAVDRAVQNQPLRESK